MHAPRLTLIITAPYQDDRALHRSMLAAIGAVHALGSDTVGIILSVGSDVTINMAVHDMIKSNDEHITTLFNASANLDHAAAANLALLSPAGSQSDQAMILRQSDMVDIYGLSRLWKEHSAHSYCAFTLGNQRHAQRAKQDRSRLLSRTTWEADPSDVSAEMAPAGIYCVPTIRKLGGLNEADDTNPTASLLSRLARSYPGQMSTTHAVFLGP